MACPGRRSGLIIVAASMFLMAAASFGVGCQQALYLPSDSRTQYDGYQRARGELAAPFVEDEFGRRTPNLRERLGPR